jgi:HK97 family phage prohead protease
VEPKTPIIERRFADLAGVDVRADEENEGIVRFKGHAAVFNQITQIGSSMWGWREQIASGAFKKTIAEADVRFLFNHNSDTVMARSTNGTLELSEDKTGLLTEAGLSLDDVDVQRLVPKLNSKNVTQMSFAFRVIVDEWDEEPDDGGLPIRTIKEVKLFDVSPVTFPAYEGTDAELVSVRALVEGSQRVKELLERAHARSTPAPEASPAEEREETVSSEQDTGQQAAPGSPHAPVSVRRRRMALRDRTFRLAS